MCVALRSLIQNRSISPVLVVKGQGDGAVWAGLGWAQGVGPLPWPGGGNTESSDGFDYTSVSLRVHLTCTSARLRFHADATRSYFGIVVIALRLHSNATLISLCVRFDLLSIRLHKGERETRLAPQGNREHSARTKGTWEANPLDYKSNSL